MKVAWHMEVKELNAILAEVGGMARFGNDDGYAVGPAAIVFPAVLDFARKVQERCLLHLQMDKTKVFCWDGILPDGAPPGISLAGCTVGGVFRPGYLCYGIPVGANEYVRHMLGEKVREVKEEVDRVKEVLSQDDGQALWTILHCSLAQKLDYHLTLCYPSDIKAVAEDLDSVLWEMLEYSTPAGDLIRVGSATRG